MKYESYGNMHNLTDLSTEELTTITLALMGIIDKFERNGLGDSDQAKRAKEMLKKLGIRSD